MGTAGMPPPEAVLTELVIMTLLAAVAEAHHTLSMAVGALNRVKDCREEKRGQIHTHTCMQMDKHMHTNRCDCKPRYAAHCKEWGINSINLRTDVLLIFWWQNAFNLNQIRTKQYNASMLNMCKHVTVFHLLTWRWLVMMSESQIRTNTHTHAQGVRSPWVDFTGGACFLVYAWLTDWLCVWWLKIMMQSWTLHPPSPASFPCS